MTIEEAYLIDRINPEDTGVGATLWISCENSHRIPRIKAEVDGISFAVAITNQKLLLGDEYYYDISTAVLIQLQMWIRLNRQTLLDYWKQRISTACFFTLMIRLPEHMVDVLSVNLNESHIFPQEKYKVQVRSCGVALPHFHVISQEEGYDVRLMVSTGDLRYVDRYGKRYRNDKETDEVCFSDVVKSAREWLELKPAHPKAAAFATNRENIAYLWEITHDYTK